MKATIIPPKKNCQKFDIFTNGQNNIAATIVLIPKNGAPENSAIKPKTANEKLRI